MPKKASKTAQKSLSTPSPKVLRKNRSAKQSPKNLVERFKVHAQDTGSPEVQVALLTKRINSLADHLRSHQKDFDSKRGLLMLVGKRRRLLNYIARHNNDTYQTLILELGLRK